MGTKRPVAGKSRAVESMVEGTENLDLLEWRNSRLRLVECFVKHSNFLPVWRRTSDFAAETCLLESASLSQPVPEIFLEHLEWKLPFSRDPRDDASISCLIGRQFSERPQV
jgi:hypothetical protein